MSIIRALPAIALIAALCSPLGASAQTAPAPVPSAAPAAPAEPAASAEHSRRHHESLWHALRAVNLTAAQKQQVATFRDEQRQANANADRATRQANNAKMRAQIMSILTADQKAQLTAELHRARRRAHPDNAAPMASPSPSAN